MPLVILTVILPDPDATRVPWGINPRHVTEVAHHQHPDLCTVAIVRGARTEAHTVLGSVAAVVAMLNRDPDALAALELEDAHLYDVNGNRAGIAHQVEREPGTESATLDALAAWLAFPTGDEQWRSAADFIEYAAELIGATGRGIDPAPWTDEDERAEDERAAALVARAQEQSR